jgi:uncharacterized protein (DUF433 family)
MVWLLANLKRPDASGQKILQDYPTLRQDDLHAAWEYARQRPEEIEDANAGREAEDSQRA